MRLDDDDIDMCRVIWYKRVFAIYIKCKGVGDKHSFTDNEGCIC